MKSTYWIWVGVFMPGSEGFISLSKAGRCYLLPSTSACFAWVKAEHHSEYQSWLCVRGRGHGWWRALAGKALSGMSLTPLNS